MDETEQADHLHRNLAERMNEIRKLHADALVLIVQKNFVFDRSNGPWEDLAFTLYTALLQVAQIAQHTLADIQGTDTAAETTDVDRTDENAREAYVDGAKLEGISS